MRVTPIATTNDGDVDQPQDKHLGDDHDDVWKVLLTVDV